MAFLPGDPGFALSFRHAADRVAGWISGFRTSPAALHDTASAPTGQPFADPRFIAKAPMRADALDVKNLVDLSSMGLKHGREITEATHPELYAAWQAMSVRAGLAKTPQLILVDSPVPNAFTLNPHEAALTTGLLQLCSFREVRAILGHELGHAQSNHVGPRVFWTGLLSGGGALLGNELGRQLSLTHTLLDGVSKWPPAGRVVDRMFGVRSARAGSTLGSLVKIAIGAGVGSVVANNIAVRATEFDADAKGVQIAQDPEAMISALEKIQQLVDRHDKKNDWRRLMAGYPSTPARIERLRGMPQPGRNDKAAETLPSGEPTTHLQTVAVSERLLGAPVQQRTA